MYSGFAPGGWAGDTHLPYIPWEAEVFFDGKPEERALYGAFAAWFAGLVPPCRMQVHKTQISFYLKTGFCFVSMPYSRRKGWPKHCLVVSLGLKRDLDTPRLIAKAHPPLKRWTCHTLLWEESQLDEELAGWVQEAAREAEG